MQKDVSKFAVVSLCLIALVALYGVVTPLFAGFGSSSVPASVAEQKSASLQVAAPCTGGQANGFPCSKIDFLAQIPLVGFSSNPGEAADIWGFVDLNDNREYAIITLENGTAVVDVTDPANPVEVETVPGAPTSWRDVKVYQLFNSTQGRWNAYAYVTADGVLGFSQEMQILDLTNLPNSVSLAGTFSGFEKAHNILISNVDYSTGQALPGMTPYVYILGANRDGGAFRILDLTDPAAPVEITPGQAGAGNSHDAATMTITGARTSVCAAGHDPCEILFNFIGDSLDIWDVTGKAMPMLLSSTTYSNLGFVHSGWPTDDGMFVTVQDELDEFSLGLNSTLRTMDISDLTAPFVSNVWTGTTQSIDHNGFFLGDLYFMSHYVEGLTLFDFSLPNDPRVIGFFDTVPGDNGPNFGGAWGVYPYLPSGTILVSDHNTGLYLLKAVTNPAPAINSVSPTTAAAGGAGVTLTVTGTNFDPVSVVRWQGSNLATTFISGAELTAVVTSSELAAGGAVDIAVFTPAPGGGATGALGFTVSSFTLGTTQNSATVMQGQSATYPIAVDPQFGDFDPTVNFSCSGLPARTGCSFSPAQVNPGASQATSTLTVSTTAEGAVAVPNIPNIQDAPRFELPGGIPVPFVLLAMVVVAVLLAVGFAMAAPVSVRVRAGLAPVLLVVLVLQVACGGSSTPPSPPTPGTPLGTHTITVNASSGTFQQSITLTLVVQ